MYCNNNNFSLHIVGKLVNKNNILRRRSQPQQVGNCRWNDFISKALKRTGVINLSFSIFQNACKVHTRTHTDDMPYTCKVCPKVFRERGSLERHVRTHTGEKPYHCTYCGRSFAEHGTLSRHLKAKGWCLLVEITNVHAHKYEPIKIIRNVSKPTKPLKFMHFYVTFREIVCRNNCGYRHSRPNFEVTFYTQVPSING